MGGPSAPGQNLAYAANTTDQPAKPEGLLQPTGWLLSHCFYHKAPFFAQKMMCMKNWLAQSFSTAKIPALPYLGALSQALPHTGYGQDS